MCTIIVSNSSTLCVVGEACCTTARAPHCHLKSRRGSRCHAMRHQCQRHSDSLVLWRVQWLWWPQLQLRLLPQSRCRRWLLPVSWCLQCSSTQSHCRLSGTRNARHSSVDLVMLCSPRCCHCVGSGVSWSWAWLPWQSFVCAIVYLRALTHTSNRGSTSNTPATNC